VASTVDWSTWSTGYAWMAGDHPAPMRRLVAEGKDSIQRAFRARACDAAAAGTD